MKAEDSGGNIDQTNFCHQPVSCQEKMNFLPQRDAVKKRNVSVRWDIGPLQYGDCYKHGTACSRKSLMKASALVLPACQCRVLKYAMETKK